MVVGLSLAIMMAKFTTAAGFDLNPRFGKVENRSMTRFSSYRPLLLALALVASACGGGDDGDDQTSGSIASETSATTIGTTTTTEPTTTTLAAPTDPAELAEFMQLSLDDLPPGYELDDQVSTDDFCEGVPNVTAAIPPLAETYREFSGDQLAFVAVAVYETAEEAIAAFQYLETGYTVECNGGETVGEGGEEIILEASQFTPQAVGGTDRLTGFVLLQSLEEFGLLVETNLAVIGTTLFLAGSSDPEVVTDMSKAVVARHGGDDTTVEIAPTGTLELLPGFGSPEYYSWIDGPSQIRSLDFSEGSAAWVQAATDQRIDELASNACVITQQFMIGDDFTVIDTGILSLFTEEEVAQYQPGDLGELYGAAVATYCPGLYEFFEQVAEAAEGSA